VGNKIFIVSIKHVIKRE